MRTLRIAERNDARLHRHRDRRTRFNRVESQIVVHAIHACDGIQIIDPAVGAMGPHRLVFRTLGQILALFIQVNARALDRAAAMAGVGQFSTALDDHVVLTLTADRLRSLKLPRAEIPRGIARRLR